MNNPTRSLLAAFVLLFAGSTGVLAAEGQYSYLRMQLNGSTHLQLGIEPELRDMSPVVAFISTTDVTGPDGSVLPANTLGIVGTAHIDMTMGKRRVLSITLHGVDGPGTYDIMEHGGVVTYSDASRGMRSLEDMLGWAAGVEEEGTSGTVTITEIGDAVPGFGWPVKGHFEFTVVGGAVFRRDYNKKRDQQEALMAGEFGWGGL